MIGVEFGFDFIEFLLSEYLNSTFLRSRLHSLLRGRNPMMQ